MELIGTIPCVMAGLDPAIQASAQKDFHSPTDAAWMAGASPAMTLE
jgi:hypothetical protein